MLQALSNNETGVEYWLSRLKALEMTRKTSVASC